MLGLPMRYLLKHPVAGIADLVADPIETWTTIREAYAEGREVHRPQYPYEPDLCREQKLHEALGVPWPCEKLRSFWSCGTR